MKDAVNIVLVLKSGGDFRMSDVYLLITHINRYWQGAIRPNVYCYTDLVSEEREVLGLTIRPLPNKEWKGWWSKMNMFSPELKTLRPFLYMDLDTAVLKSISGIIPPKDIQNNFITLKDFYRPRNLASGVMWIPDTAYMDKVYSEWLSNAPKNMVRFRGDQNFIESVTPANLYWQDILTPDSIVSFKPVPGQWRINFPDKSAIVCFHGTPRIPKAALIVDWVKKYESYEL